MAASARRWPWRLFRDMPIRKNASCPDETRRRRRSPAAIQRSAREMQREPARAYLAPTRLRACGPDRRAGQVCRSATRGSRTFFPHPRAGTPSLWGTSSTGLQTPGRRRVRAAACARPRTGATSSLGVRRDLRTVWRRLDASRTRRNRRRHIHEAMIFPEIGGLGRRAVAVTRGTR